MDAASPRRRWVMLTLVAYGLLVVVILVSPLSYGGIVRFIGEWLDQSVGISGFGTGWIEFIANVLMFVPLGLLLTLLLRHHWYGVALALALSALAELGQFAIPARQPSLRDILANVLGAAIGAALAWLLVLHRDRITPPSPPTETTHAR